MCGHLPSSEFSAQTRRHLPPSSLVARTLISCRKALVSKLGATCDNASSTPCPGRASSGIVTSRKKNPGWEWSYIVKQTPPREFSSAVVWGQQDPTIWFFFPLMSSLSSTFFVEREISVQPSTTPLSYYSRCVVVVQYPATDGADCDPPPLLTVVNSQAPLYSHGQEVVWREREGSWCVLVSVCI